MAFEDILAEISLLIRDMEINPEDKHELYLSLRTKLAEMRTMGMPVPDDLAHLETALEEEFSAGRIVDEDKPLPPDR